MMEQALIDQIVQAAQTARKYRDLDLPEELLIDLLENESSKGLTKTALEHAFRKKLHNVVAPYLEDLDYAAESAALEAQNLETADPQTLRALCLRLLSKHASTRERLPKLEAFYECIFTHVPDPHSIQDLACGLNPLALPWMQMPANCTYHAYDLHHPRVDLLNQFFASYYPNAQAVHQDILVNPPTQNCELAFFFKEAHRFEKRQPGCLRTFFESINAKTIAVSLPAADLSGHHSLADYHTSLIEKAITGKPWRMNTDQIGDELLFFIEKA